MAYHRAHDVPVKIARIFNTYGPRMRRDDGTGRPDVHRAGPRGRADHRARRRLTDPLALLRRRSRSRGSGGSSTPTSSGCRSTSATRRRSRCSTWRGRSCSSRGANPRVVFTERPIDDPEVRCPDISRARSCSAGRRRSPCGRPGEDHPMGARALELTSTEPGVPRGGPPRWARGWSDHRHRARGPRSLRPGARWRPPSSPDDLKDTVRRGPQLFPDRLLVGDHAARSARPASSSAPASRCLAKAFISPASAWIR